MSSLAASGFPNQLARRRDPCHKLNALQPHKGDRDRSRTITALLRHSSCPGTHLVNLVAARCKIFASDKIATKLPYKMERYKFARRSERQLALVVVLLSSSKETTPHHTTLH
jgi:hypothetical protein